MVQNSTLYGNQQQESVVVKLWEIYLLYHPANLYKTLTDKSLDYGPRHDERLSGRITFRFAPEMWESEIRNLLHEYRIPVSIQSTPPGIVGTRGRAPFLR